MRGISKRLSQFSMLQRIVRHARTGEADVLAAEREVGVQQLALDEPFSASSDVPASCAKRTAVRICAGVRPGRSASFATKALADGHLARAPW
jgi:hypothetical protein